MPLIEASACRLVIIDFQARLMPAIHDGARMVANARRLADAAALLGLPVVMTEQNPAGLGKTVPELADAGRTLLYPGEAETVYNCLEFDAMDYDDDCLFYLDDLTAAITKTHATVYLAGAGSA